MFYLNFYHLYVSLDPGRRCPARSDLYGGCGPYNVVTLRILMHCLNHIKWTQDELEWVLPMKDSLELWDW